MRDLPMLHRHAIHIPGAPQGQLCQIQPLLDTAVLQSGPPLLSQYVACEFFGKLIVPCRHGGMGRKHTLLANGVDDVGR